MWVYEKNLNYTALIQSPSFPEVLYKITECWLKGGLILFAAKGAYFILAKNDSINGGFFNDFGYKSVNVIGQITRTRYYKSGATWVLNQGIPEGQKFVKIKNTTCQVGEYFYNQSSKKWVAQIATNSDPVADIPQEKLVSAELYKSSSLTGVYKWQSTDTVKADLKVGWHYYTHKELDGEGNPTQTDIDVYESLQLNGTPSRWSYTYKGIIYYYFGELPESDFIMQSRENILNMSYVSLTSLNKSVWKFDTGAQIVL